MAEAAGSVIPVLTVAGGMKAIAFYREVFGARETFRMMTEDQERVFYARLAVGNGVIMLCDPLPEVGSGPGAPAAGPPAGVAVALAFAAAAEVDATFAAALAAGATAEFAPADAFWGDRFATLRDPFGHCWMLSAPRDTAPMSAD